MTVSTEYAKARGKTVWGQPGLHMETLSQKKKKGKKKGGKKSTS